MSRPRVHRLGTAIYGHRSTVRPHLGYPAAYHVTWCGQYTTTHLPGDSPTVTPLGYPASISRLGRATSRLPGASPWCRGPVNPRVARGPPHSVVAKESVDSKERKRGPRGSSLLGAPVPSHRPVRLCPSELPGIGTWWVSVHHGGGRPSRGACHAPEAVGGPAGRCCDFLSGPL